MKILAMDTSTWALAVAVAEDGKLLGEFNSYIPTNHSLRLMPAIEQLLKQLALQPGEIDLIAVGHGPGSYTGVRIGVTTAKVLAWSLGVPLLGLSSLQVVAQNKADFKGLILPLFDARRGQAYAGLYQGGSHVVKPVRPDRIQLFRAFLQEVSSSIEEPILVMGDGVKAHRTTILEELGERALFLSGSENFSQGKALAELAWVYREEASTHVHRFAPQYLQLAEAERKWLDRYRSS